MTPLASPLIWDVVPTPVGGEPQVAARVYMRMRCSSQWWPCVPPQTSLDTARALVEALGAGAETQTLPFPLYRAQG